MPVRNLRQIENAKLRLEQEQDKIKESIDSIDSLIRMLKNRRLLLEEKIEKFEGEMVSEIAARRRKKSYGNKS